MKKTIVISSFCLMAFIAGYGFLKPKIEIKEHSLDEAKNAYSSAAFGLAHLYKDGVCGEKKDIDKAILLYEQSSQYGNKYAQNFLGELYLKGDVIQKDLDKALSYFQLAAQNGDAAGQNNLGLMYASSESIKKDYIKAAQYFKQSAEQGWSEANFNLGICYALGLGIEKNMDEARVLLERGTKMGIHKEHSESRQKHMESFLKDLQSYNKYWLWS